MNRFWHKVKAWFGLHPRPRFWLRTVARGLLALVVVAGVVGFAATFYFHGQDSSKIKADRAAEQARVAAQQDASRASGVAIRRVLCPLVYIYVHLGQHSPNGPQVAAGWRAVGALVGCPDGTPPR